MKFTRLRLSGFKSFVEPTDLLIEPGLTGVVGPNGCGKSNLLEALRWVMGESSYKSMRASGMDDVIFSGTTQRPSRNMAEVMVTMSNDDRSAPPQHNDSEVIEISRRIEREAGSAYRINGKDVRARDVQLLFADVSTGARSPALVRQGQIAEIINAKPQARRLILEEAAGITGLHTRRHEAELKLKAAEVNLTRLEDVTSQLESQLNSLKRQARQAQKYKVISAEIRKLEAAGLYVAWKEAVESADRDAAALDESTRVLAENTRAASEKLRARDELGEKLPGLREQETIRAAVLQRMAVERNSLDEEERRVEGRRKELDQRLLQAVADLTREHESLRDTDGVIARLVEEDTALKGSQNNDGDLRAEAALALQSVASALATAQDVADQAGARLSELTARRGAITRTIDEQRQRIVRLERDASETGAKRQALLDQMGATGDGPTLAAAAEAAVAVLASNETAANHAEAALRVARQIEADTRQTHDEARRKAEGLQTEVRTLTNLLKAADNNLWPALVDQLKVERGYEAALGAALGDDIDASSDEGAPTHWRGLPPLEDGISLPGEAKPLSNFVQAPQALARRLSHIGVVSRSLGQALQAQLRSGHRLMSQEGDVWRCDGFTSAADAPNAAAKRLAERNRLSLLEVEMRDAAAVAGEAAQKFEAAKQSVELGARTEREKREALRAATSSVEVSRQALAKHERQIAERLAQTSALDEGIRRIAQSLDEVRASYESAQTEFQAIPVLEGLAQEVAALRDNVNRERAAYAEARAKHDGLEREAKARAERLATLEAERKQWGERAKRATEQIEHLTTRAQETREAIAELSGMPQILADKRRTLMNLLQEAETERKAAADSLAEG